MLSEKELRRNVRVWAQAARLVKKEHGDLPDECRRYFIIRTIIDMQIHDVVETSERLIQKAGVQSADDVRLCAKRAGAAQSRTPQAEPGTARLPLQKSLLQPRGASSRNLRAVKMLGELFQYYLAHPKEIGESARKRIRKAGLHRAVCDYLAGMTDRYVMLEHERIFGEKIQSRVTVSSLRQSGKQFRDRLPLPRQNQIRRDFTQRLKHKPPQMRARMRQNQLRRIRAFHFRTRSNPSPADAARSKLFWAARPNSFSSPRSFFSNDSGVSSACGTRPATAFTNFGESGGQSTGEVCQSEDLRIGAVGKTLQPRHRVGNNLAANRRDSSQAQQRQVRSAEC